MNIKRERVGESILAFYKKSYMLIKPCFFLVMICMIFYYFFLALVIIFVRVILYYYNIEEKIYTFPSLSANLISPGLSTKGLMHNIVFYLLKKKKKNYINQMRNLGHI